MFDLNEAVERWRGSFGEGMRAEDLDELEEHLLAEVEKLAAGGLSLEESMLVATRRLGGARELVGEFAKVHGDTLWLPRLRWMLIGYVAIYLLQAVLSGLVGLGTLAALSQGLEQWVIVGTQASVCLMGIAALTWVFLRLSRNTLPRGLSFKLLVSSLVLALPVLLLIPTVVMRDLTRVPSDQRFALMIGTATTLRSAAILLPLVLCLVVYLLERRERVARA